MVLFSVVCANKCSVRLCFKGEYTNHDLHAFPLSFVNLYVIYIMPRCILEHSFILEKNCSDSTKSSLKQHAQVFDGQHICYLWWTCFSTDSRHSYGCKLWSSSRLLVIFFSYEAVIIQELLQKNEKKLIRSFNFTFRYIDDVRSLNNSRFGEFVDRLYPIELEINDTTHTERSASYLDLHLKIDSKGRLRTDTLRQKR